MEKIIININKEVLNNLLHEVSNVDYVIEGIDILNTLLPLILKDNKTIEEKTELKKYSKRLAEVNLILEMLSSLGD